MKVYTRRGDAGETDLLGEGRVAKDDLRVRAYGDVDELNASLGLYAAASADEGLKERVQVVQSALFTLGSQLAAPDAAKRAKSGIPSLVQEDIDALEADIDAFEAELEPLERFILPGGSGGGAALHHARTVCRRAERSAVALGRSEAVEPIAMAFLNRLSDWLFVAARLENHRAGVTDVVWEGRGRG